MVSGRILKVIAFHLGILWIVPPSLRSVTGHSAAATVDIPERFRASAIKLTTRNTSA
jgi:hypothetical protein